MFCYFCAKCLRQICPEMLFLEFIYKMKLSMETGSDSLPLYSLIWYFMFYLAIYYGKRFNITSTSIEFWVPLPPFNKKCMFRLSQSAQKLFFCYRISEQIQRLSVLLWLSINKCWNNFLGANMWWKDSLGDLLFDLDSNGEGWISTLM